MKKTTSALKLDIFFNAIFFFFRADELAKSEWADVALISPG